MTVIQLSILVWVVILGMAAVTQTVNAGRWRQAAQEWQKAYQRARKAADDWSESAHKWEAVAAAHGALGALTFEQQELAEAQIRAEVLIEVGESGG